MVLLEYLFLNKKKRMQIHEPSPNDGLMNDGLMRAVPAMSAMPPPAEFTVDIGQRPPVRGLAAEGRVCAHVGARPPAAGVHVQKP